MDVRPFTRDDVPFAAQLLANRGNAHPLVPPIDAVAEIDALLDDGHTGYVTAGGYLLGKVEPDAAWTLYAGHAARDVMAYRHLYRAIGRDWVEAGQHRHAIVMPEGDAVAGPAFANLAFGREHVFALASLAGQPSAPDDPRVRVATTGDVDELRPMFGMLARHLEEGPVWSPRPRDYWDHIEADFEEDLADPDTTYLAAWDGETCAGFSTWGPMPKRVAVPDGAFALGHMVVRPEYRGRGLGNAMTLAGLALARERGATVTWTDWRLTNMSAEPYWRTFGWTPYNVRMTRRVEPDPD